MMLTVGYCQVTLRYDDSMRKLCSLLEVTHFYDLVQVITHMGMFVGGVGVWGVYVW